MSTGTINYTHRGYIVVELNQQMNTIHLHRSRNSATKGILFEFCMEFFHSEKETPWIEYTLNSLHERWWNLCAVAIKWSRSNDNFETTNAEFQRKKRSEPSIIWIRNPYTQIIAENYRKYYLFTFYLYPSGYFQQSEEKMVCVRTLSHLRQRYFRFISDFRIFAFDAKSETETATLTQSAAHKIAILFSAFLLFCCKMEPAYSLLDQNMKRKMCFVFVIFCFSFCNMRTVCGTIRN